MLLERIGTHQTFHLPVFPKPWKSIWYGDNLPELSLFLTTV